MKLLRALARFALVSGCLGISALAATANAQQPNFPQRPITITVSSAPGGFDSLVRMLTESMGKTLGHPVVVTNRPGANGMIGIQAVRTASADGHNILFATNSTMVMNPNAYKSATYSAVDDFEPIAAHAMMPMVWVANKTANLHSMQDLIEFAKKNPGQLKVSNHGPGGGAQLYETLLARQYGLDILQVPYTSAAQTIMSLLAGDVNVGVETLSTIMPRIQEGKVVALALVGPGRLASLPSIPSWTEGIMPPKYGVVSWYGFFAPKGTPKDVVLKLNQAIIKALEEKSVKDQMESLGATFNHMDPEAFRTFVGRERDFYRDIFTGLGIRAN
jgi:tripartite-type tricarboxylate transporter receptor subunit TctC